MILRALVAFGVTIILVSSAMSAALSGQGLGPSPMANSTEGQDLAPYTPAQLQRAMSKMDEPLIASLRGSDGLETIIVHLGVQADLRPVTGITSLSARRQYVYDALRARAAATQAPMRAYLETLQARGDVTSYQSFFIFNGFSVTANREAVVGIALRDEVERVTRERVYEISGAQPFAPPADKTIDARSEMTKTAEWNLLKVGVDKVWLERGITGEGVVVANVDTGVSFQHPALLEHYGGWGPDGVYDHHYHWYDATPSNLLYPADGNGHGSHTMGIMVGGDGPGDFIHDVGMAPGATWIAVRAFDDLGRTSSSILHSAFEWLLAPCPIGAAPGSSLCDPVQAPDVVNNSWGSRDGSVTEFLPDVRALLAAGIMPVFSAGNYGPGSGTVGSPASFAESLAVGAIDANELAAQFSSRGPSSQTQQTKPDLTAPGVGVRSTFPGNSYQTLNGTSMAAPHVAGLIALMLAADPTLTADALTRVLLETAVDLGDSGPDNTYGWGRIAADKAVGRVLDGGVLSGSVRHALDGHGLAGIRLRLTSADLELSTTSASDGSFAFTDLLAGTYALAAGAYGFEPWDQSDISIEPGAQEVVDVRLEPLPIFLIRGQVRSASAGNPVIPQAQLTALGTPLPAVITDAEGTYTLALASGPITLEAAAFGFATAITTTDVFTHTTIDFILDPLPPVLLVDDDEGAQRSISPHVEPAYMAALEANGYRYDYWDIEKAGSPSFAHLRQYAAVIWFGGEFGRIKDMTDAAQAEALMAYVNLGGQLLYVAQSHTFYYGDDKACDSAQYGGDGPCPFTTSILGVADWVEDQQADFLAGRDAHPVGDGLGPWPMTYPSSLTDFSDHITGTTVASLAFTSTDDFPVWQSHHVGYSLEQGLPAARSLFMATPIEALAPRDMADLVHSAMAWFGVSGLQEGLSLTPSSQELVGIGGEELRALIRIRNFNSEPEHFDLTLAPSGWPATIWDASHSQPIATIGPVAPGDTADFLVEIQVPLGALPGDREEILVQASSKASPRFRAEARIQAKSKVHYWLEDSEQCGGDVPFTWIDATPGQKWLLDNRSETAAPSFISVTLPSAFRFYDSFYTQVWFNDFGTILFGDQNIYDDQRPSADPPIPSGSSLDPNNAIYLNWGTSFWHPSSQAPDSGVYTYHDQSQGRNRFVIEYHLYENLRGAQDTFQAVLDLASYEITLQYLVVSDSRAAVVGIENEDGSEGLLYVNKNQPPEHQLRDGLAVHFGVGQAIPRYQVDLETSQTEGETAPGLSITYPFTVTNLGNVREQFDLATVGGLWPTTILSGTTGVSVTTALAPCAFQVLALTVHVPNDALFQADEVTLQARSRTNPVVVASEQFRTWARPDTMYPHYLPAIIAR